MPITQAAIEYFKKIVATSSTLEPMLLQRKHYPLKGMEHKFIGKKGGMCKYCSYHLDNINHVSLGWD